MGVRSTRSALPVIIACIALLGGCGRRETTQTAGPEPEQSPWFEEVAAARGLSFVHQSGHRPGQYLMPEIACGGAAVLDIDGDGWLDVYLVQSGSLWEPQAKQSGNRLFRNRGDGTFDDVTAGSGADAPGYGMGVAAGDYDNDGDTDLYVTNVGPNVLLENDGHGRFTDVTATAGLGDPSFSSSAAFVDYDADGHLDLIVVNYIVWSIAQEVNCAVHMGPDYCTPNAYNAPAPSTLYHNNGNGTFTDLSVAAGLRTAFGNGLGVVAADFDGDGRIDIFVANDSMMNQLWMNQGDGKFTDAAVFAGCALDQHGQAKAGMGVVAEDIDDDGDADLLVVNLQNETDSFYRNQGGYFVDGTGAIGIATTSRQFTRFGVGMGDFDNDGFLDLYEANGRVARYEDRYGDDPYAEPNVLFRGSACGRFQETLPRGGTKTLLAATSRAAAFGDIDNDGGLDVVVVNRDGPAHLLHNVVNKRGHWISFRVVNEHGSDALGAILTFSLGNRRITRYVRAAYSYCASNDPRVHVGLGQEVGVRDVAVRWPDGQTESFGDFACDQIVTLRRGVSRDAL